MLHVAKFYVSSKEVYEVDFEHLPYCNRVGLTKLEYKLFVQRDYNSKHSAMKITGFSGVC